VPDAPDVSNDVEESRWPRFMERCPLGLALLIGAASPISGSATSLVSGHAKVVLWATAAGAALVSLGLTLAREDRRKKLERAVEERRKQADDDNQSLIDGQLSPVLQLVAELVATEDETRRQTTAGEVRTALVVAASKIFEPAKVRANLFEMENRGDDWGDDWCMRSKRSHGRGRKSTRTFEGDDPTMIKTLQGDYRFVDHVEGLEYETYITHPITDGTTTYGVLTIDALHSGELSEDRDIGIVRVMATIAATAYAAVKAPGVRVR
jgi:transcriptional regulator with GAF, ATPase, and Fis domain